MRNRLSAVAMAAIALTLVTGLGLNLSGCAGFGHRDDLSGIDFRGEMRALVQEVSSYARATNPSFIVIPQNGHELLTQNGDAEGVAASDYIAAINAVGREDLFYGYDADNRATPAADTLRIAAFTDLAIELGIDVLVTDYCSTPSFVDDSYAQSAARGYISFAADSRELDTIPSHPTGGYDAHAGAVSSLSQARNFLYLINPANYATAGDFVSALDATDYDAFVIDLFFDGDQLLSSESITELQSKPDGAQRLVIAYMSVGEAEEYRYYWQQGWKRGNPVWLEDENAIWGGNFVVRYWDDEWKAIISGSADSYLGRIIDAGFDGVYLDIIDAYEYFEQYYQ